MLKAGEIIQVGGKTYRIGYVNESRAYCVPLSGSVRQVTDPDGNPREFESLGGAINISPHSLVDRLTEEDLTNAEAARLDRQRDRQQLTDHQRSSIMAGVSPVPVADKSARAKDQARRANVAASKSARPPGSNRAIRDSKNGNGAVAKKERPVNDCLCGCGETTGGYFAMGHDSKFKSWMTKIERGDMDVADLPKSVQKAYEFKKRGKGFVTTKNYKGESHAGYDKA